MSNYESSDWYATPRYYDIVFDEGTRQEVAFLEAVHARYVCSPGKRVLEPACGTGRLLHALARRGFSVTGIDLSEPMLAFARRRFARSRLRGRFLKARMEAFHAAGSFDFAFCFVSSFKYLLDDDAAQAHLRCVAQALRPGGVYALGLHLTNYDCSRITRERWLGSRGPTHVVCNIQGWPADRRTRTERVRSRLVITEHGTIRRYETQWLFRTYSAGQLRRLLRQLPQFELVAVHDFRYDIEQTTPIDASSFDVLLILRRLGA